MVRNRLFALGAGAVLLLSGCTDDAAASGGAPPVQVVRPPAASAGGACILWDYARIQEQLGVLFDVAAAGEADDTSTCVVQADGATRPDLLLSVVEQTPADAALYRAELVPERAVAVTKLGKAGYRVVIEAAGDRGPAAEVGWLTADRQLMTLRFTYPADASTADADAMAGKLVALARTMDF
jgi:hypothetical protein